MGAKNIGTVQESLESHESLIQQGAATQPSSASSEADGLPHTTIVWYKYKTFLAPIAIIT
jgi:hypothetical protein